MKDPSDDLPKCNCCGVFLEENSRELWNAHDEEGYEVCDACYEFHGVIDESDS